MRTTGRRRRIQTAGSQKLSVDHNNNDNQTNDSTANEGHTAPPLAPKKKSTFRKWMIGTVAGTAIVGTPAGLFGLYEVHESDLQSKYFNEIASGKRFTTKITDPLIFPPAKGPFDDRRGYSHFAAYDQTLTARGKWERSFIAPWYDRNIHGIQLNLLEDEKQQAGATITDYTGDTMYQARFPRNVYKTFDDVPKKLLNALLFVENAELLADHPDKQNPAVEWDRFTKASFHQVLKKMGVASEYPGGSTAAVQKEKYKYSGGGRTESPIDKLQQMASATARAYKDGVDTTEVRKDIALDYINSIPLSSYPGQGDVEGIGDGIALWFGRDFAELNHLLTKDESTMDDAEMAEAGQAFREAFYLALSIKKPSEYLLRTRGRDELNARVDNLLPRLAREGIISERMRDAALNAKLEFSKSEDIKRKMAVPHNKTEMSLRIEMMNALGVKTGLYGLDRTDASAITTVNKDASEAVTQFLHGLKDVENVRAAGLLGYPMLKETGLEDITYSFTLYEAGEKANYLRVQTDTYQGALNLNEGSKLQLGSTAKLRTLVTYLECMAYLHEQLSGKDVFALEEAKDQYKDNLSRWAIDYLIAEKSKDEPNLSLRALLDASMERRYSANPGETFFTGGGIHRFNNFKNDENGRVPTVRETLQNSHNLPSVRIMRDIVNFTMEHKMDVPDDIFTNPDSPQRARYLEQFINKEGKVFLYRAWNAQRDKSRDDIFTDLVNKRDNRAQYQIAALYRMIFPEGSVEHMANRLHEIEYRQDNPDASDDAVIEHMVAKSSDEKVMKKMQAMYTMYDPARFVYEPWKRDPQSNKFNLNDLAFITKVHPLDLWLAHENTKTDTPLSWSDAYAAAIAPNAEGETVMKDIYSWLLKPHKMEAQNKRLRIILEEDAFTHIHKMWAKNGFSFEKMTPSLGSALGDSGDTPAALAEFSGIIVNGGIRKPSIRFTDMTLAPDTEERERAYTRKPEESVRVMPQEVADVALETMQLIVRDGTGFRAGKVVLDDGRVLNVGGKTGTGDNRDKFFTAGGGMTSAEVKNRTATFVFEIDDPVSGKRFFGSVLLYVDGPNAAKHKFTSAGPTQVLKNILVMLKPFLNEACGVTAPAQTAALDQKKNAPKAPAP